MGYAEIGLDLGGKHVQRGCFLETLWDTQQERPSDLGGNRLGNRGKHSHEGKGNTHTPFRGWGLPTLGPAHTGKE